MEYNPFYLAALFAFPFVNALAIFLFWYDKKAAISEEWRISETQLLTIAFLGGSLGASYACRKFRHKTKKQPFAFLLFAILTLQIAILLGVISGWVFSQIA